MSTPHVSFFGTSESSDVRKMNIDELYEKNHERNKKQIACYNKILNRIHGRIRIANQTAKRLWFQVPHIIFGEALYELSQCIPYVVVKLEGDGFIVRFTPPNILEISWDHWIPTYMRNEIFKKTGVRVDCTGKVISDPEAEEEELQKAQEEANTKEKKKPNYVSTGEYKPTGNFVYNPEIFERLEKKLGRN